MFFPNLRDQVSPACKAISKIIVLYILIFIYVYIVGACHHGMTCPQVADGGMASYMEDSANILNKQSWTADMGWSSS
jgi:hypothetical protein